LGRLLLHILGAAGLVLLGGGADFRASGQTPAQAIKQPAANTAIAPAVVNPLAIPNKIWTNEDLVALRKPWDIYLDQEIDAWQQAQEEAKKAAEAAASGTAGSGAKPAQPTTLTDNSPIPTTVDALEIKLNATRQEARQLAADLDTLKKTYDAETDDDRRAKLKLDIDLLERDLADRQADIALLQARITELNGGAPATGTQSNGTEAQNPDQSGPATPATPPSSTPANSQPPAAPAAGPSTQQASTSTQGPQN
jgi:hypothetical protein